SARHHAAGPRAANSATADHGGEPLCPRLGRLLPRRQLPNSAEEDRPMATPQAPLRAPQARQEPGDDRRLPAEERRRGEASTTTGRVGKRMVAARPSLKITQSYQWS